ncbi:hypothetical protein IV102_05775 [bacterium]|nr:hypothetical protein [bacterium]
MKKGARRGFSLALVMCLLILALAGVMQLVSLIYNQRITAQNLEYQDRAARYANNALEYTVAELEKDSNFRGEVLFKAQPGDRSDAQGRVTFDPASTYHSTNNFEGKDLLPFEVAGFRRQVPPNTIHILSQGRYAGKTVYTEAFVAVPAYDYAIAASGSLTTDGAFLVGALDDPNAWQGSTDTDDFKKALRRASMVSNSGADPAISLSGAPVRITGNLITPGKVLRGPNVQVDGQVEEGHRPLGLPDIPLSDLDPAGKPLLRTLEEEDFSGDLTGFARRTGDLRVTGDLVLKDGLLYVDGNLNVTGAISGIGCVVVTGRTSLSSVTLKAVEQVALLSVGDLSISGQGQENSTLVGLLYSRGNLSLSDVTVVGAVVAGGQQVTLRNVNMLKSPKGVSFSFEQGFVGGTQSAPIAGGLPGVGDVVVRLKQVSNGQGGMRDPRPSDFAPPKSFIPDEAMEVVDAVTGAPGGDLSDYINLDAGRSFKNSVVQQVPTEAPTPVKIISTGEVDLDLNRFLKLADKLKVIYRKTHYGIPSEPAATS